MRKTLIISAISLWLMLTSILPPQRGLAQTADIPSGLPNSPKFAYGARLDTNGWQPEDAITIAASMGLDWLSIDFNWSAFYPTPESTPNLDLLTASMAVAQQNGCSVMLSILGPPSWALSPNGPDPNLTAQQVLALARRFPGVIQAVELFPEANTALGWGAAPNPAGYMTLLHSVDDALKAEGHVITLVAGGLTPAAPGQDPAKVMDDGVFLQSLYDLGGAANMPIISLHLNDLTGDPLAAPSAEEHRVLRHYEEIRQVMLNADHRNGLIWITSLGWPQGAIRTEDALYLDPQEQARWLEQAYKLMVAQLYLGAAFYAQLNTPAGDIPDGTPSAFILVEDQLHPGFVRLGQLIAPGSATPTPAINLAPQETSTPTPSTLLVKKLIRQYDYKPRQT